VSTRGEQWDWGYSEMAYCERHDLYYDGEYCPECCEQYVQSCTFDTCAECDFDCVTCYLEKRRAAQEQETLVWRRKAGARKVFV
jgi:hypothetical protein